MKCPRCPDSPLEHLSKKGVEFHGCRNCKGLLVEKDSLLRLIEMAQAQREREQGKAESSQDNYFESLVTASEFTKNNTPITCPKCRYDMYETENRGIELDFCLNCQSIWFDAGELQDIVHRLHRGETFNLVPLPASELDHTSGVILQLLRDEWL